jgi:hypothetical protein
MDAETPKTVQPPAWRYSIRSLLLFAAALAAMLSIMKLLQIPLLPSPVLLLVAILLPVWLPLCFLPAESLWQRLRPLLALVSAGWYVWVIDGRHFQEPSYVTLGLGYAAAALALAFSARGRRHLINVPLWLALLASAWAILSRAAWK